VGRRSQEHEEQKALFEWSALKSRSDPRLELLFAIPNGGHRHIAVAKRMKAEGVKRGVPDIMLPLACGKYHGLFVELKAAKGRVSDHQHHWLSRLTEEGYWAEVCYGCEEAIRTIEVYLAEDSKAL